MKKSVFVMICAVLVIACGAVFFNVHAADQPMPAVGQAAPGFTLPSQDGSQISLSSFKGKWVVLYFYPKDMTTGCTIEAHKFQEALPQLGKIGLDVIGVSKDKIKPIIDLIKGTKLKVNAQYQDEQIRVSAKSKDDLQKVQSLLTGLTYELPLQFTNYR